MPHKKALKHIRKLWAEPQFRRDLAIGLVSLLLAVGLTLYWLNREIRPAPPPPGPQVLMERDVPGPAAIPPQAALEPAVPAPATPPKSEPAKIPAWKRNAVVLATPPQAPMIAIVLDDMGPNRKGTERALDLPASITFSFLPYAPKVADFVKAARQRGHEIIVHVPMEPMGHADPGPHALRTGETDQQLDADLVWNLSQFDGYVGINNHMGSRFTADAKGMALVMKTLKARGLMFLDSRTSAQTEAANAAHAAGLPTLSRDVFLDNDEEGTEVTAELGRVEEIARKHGAAIAIGHPHAVTLDMLEKWIPQARARGFTLVPLTAILKYHEAT